MSAKVLIDAQTGASVSESFLTSRRHPITLTAYNLDGVEEVTVQVSYKKDAWQDLYVDGNKVTMTVTNNTICTDMPGEYRVSKGVTVNEVTVGLHSIYESI